MTTEHDKAVAWLDLSKMTPSGMVYATGFKVNDKQTPLFTRQQIIEELAQRSGVMPKLYDPWYPPGTTEIHRMCRADEVIEAIASLEARNQQLEAQANRFAAEKAEAVLQANAATERYESANRMRNAALGDLGQSKARVRANQARIDELMLEYCPDEMTPEQVSEWAKHQKKAIN